MTSPAWHLESIDSELDETERAVAELEALLPPSLPQTGASRFPERSFASGNGPADLNIQRADVLVRSGKPSFNFGAAVGRFPEGATADGWRADKNRCQPPPVPTPVTCEKTRGTASSSSRTPRWVNTASADGSSIPGERLVVRLTRASVNEPLGITPERSSRSLFVISRVSEPSAAARWNAQQARAGWIDRQLTKGDIILKVNGVSIVTAFDARQAAADSSDVRLEILRESATIASSPQSTADLLKPRSPSTVLPTKTAAIGFSSSKQEASTWNSTLRSPIVEGSRPVESAISKEPHLPSEPLLPGRCTRATPTRHVVVGTKQPTLQVPTRDMNLPHYSFGSTAKRFKEEVKTSADSDGISTQPSPLADDKFLSTRPTPRAAMIAQGPRMERKGDRSAKRRKKAMSARVPRCAEDTFSIVGSAHSEVQEEDVLGIRRLRSAWGNAFGGDSSDSEGSTEPGSAPSEDTSFWSAGSQLSDGSSLPGPGEYSPDFAVTLASKAKGVPSFARYSAREQFSEESEELQERRRKGAEAMLAATMPSQKKKPPPIPDAVLLPKPHVRGGVIQPPPTTSARKDTIQSEDEHLNACRPFYDAHDEATKPNAAQVSIGTADTKRSEVPKAVEDLGPAYYEGPKPELPNQLGALICEPTRAPSRKPLEEESGPAPGDYEADPSVALPRVDVKTTDLSKHTGRYPKSVDGTFDERLQVMEVPGFRPPKYVVEYSDLDSKVDLVKRRSHSANIWPESKRERANLMPLRKRSGGPAYYHVQDGRVMPRTGKLVVEWPSISKKEYGHDHLYTDRPVDRHVMGDRRSLMSPEFDEILRRQPKFGLMRALSVPSFTRKPDGRWVFYDLPYMPEPLGFVDFSRRMSFEEFEKQEQKWLERHRKAIERHQPNLQLSYDALELEVFRQRAPRADFASGLGRRDAVWAPGEDHADDSLRDGDVLQLSMEAEKNLFHPRSTSGVNMDRQVGRGPDGHPEWLAPEPPDEELKLSPRRTLVEKRVPFYVDFNRQHGRADHLDLSAHLWADDHGGAYTFTPLGEQVPSGKDEPYVPPHSDLSPRRSDRYLRRRPPFGDFQHALGRPGIDPRLPVDDGGDDECLKTNWTTPPKPSRRPKSESPRPLRVQGGWKLGHTTTCAGCAARLSDPAYMKSRSESPWRIGTRSAPAPGPFDTGGGVGLFADDDDFVQDGLV